MWSVVADTLFTAAETEKVDLSKKISEIQKRITLLKYDVEKFMDDNYVEFVPRLKKDQYIASTSEKSMKEIKILQQRVEEQTKIKLSGSTRELKSLSQSLKESNIALEFSSQLLGVHDCIKSLDTLIKNKQYVEAAKTLQKMKDLLNNPHSDLKNLNIHQALCEEYYESFGKFLRDVENKLCEYINMEGNIESNKKTVSTLTIRCTKEDVEDLIQALFYIESLPKYLNNFTRNLMKFFIGPIIHFTCKVFVRAEQVFTVEILDKKQVNTYESVLYNLRLLFQFLHQHLNVRIDNERTFINHMQDYLLQEFSEVLIKDCIANTIPSSSEEFKNYEPVIQNINEFQDYLVEFGFISNEQRFLSNYTKNIDTLFVDKMCLDLLVKGKDIMKKDLHDSVKYEPQKIIDLNIEEEEGTSDFEMQRKLSKDTFQLPACQISKSVKEILKLARDILDEACKSSDECAVRLFYTCRNIFEMYVGLVPEHHKKFLETIPQQVALFHNNCIYLAHHLLTLGHEYRNKLPEVLRQHNITFTDQCLKLRDVASDQFLDHMKYQRDIIFEILRDSGLSTLGQAPKLPPTTEKALRQCIRQLELLKTVWLEVLPVNIYCRALGCIMNSMIEDLIMKVTSVEDIPADVATDLVTLFNMIVKRAPSIFPESDLITRYVIYWRRFEELIIVLGASLKEIESRWANGKGPLARQFTADQVKQLIRALFQNTDRRSALLSNIK